MLLNIVYIAAGFALLIKGADYLVDGASSIAQRLGISTLVIGLTVVAFGTSAPELAVNVLAALNGSAGLALGNINGSNIANVLLILGMSAMFATIPVKSRTVLKEIPFMLLSGIVLVVLISDIALNAATETMISRSDGLILLAFFGIFMYYLFLSSKDTKAAKTEKPKYSLFLGSVFTVMGLIGLVLGGHFTVTGASELALALGISQTLVGLTIVAVGTSLPELVSSIIAVRKGQSDLAIGGVVGSNIFNILLVLGTTATITPIAVDQANIIDSLIAFAIMIVLLLSLFVHKPKGFKTTKGIGHIEGVVFVLLYIAYIAYVIWRG